MSGALMVFAAVLLRSGEWREGESLTPAGQAALLQDGDGVPVLLVYLRECDPPQVTVFAQSPEGWQVVYEDALVLGNELVLHTDAGPAAKVRLSLPPPAALAA